MGKYGKYADDGSVEEEATECILTERPLTAPYDNTVRYSVKGTKMFFRILSSQHYRATNEMIEEWRSGGEIPAAESMPIAGNIALSQTDERARSNKRARDSFNDSIGATPVAGSDKPE